MPVLVSTCKHDKQYIFHHNLKSSIITPSSANCACVCVCGGGYSFSRPSVRQCLHPSVRRFRISNNKEVSDKFQKHVLVIMTFAFVTSYCFRQKLCFDFIFDSNKLLSHLLECFENNRISEYPLTSKTMSTRRKKRDKTIKLQNYCPCNLPECFDDMVQFDK